MNKNGPNIYEYSLINTLKRVWIAYKVTLKVVFSYLWLIWASKIYGPEYFDTRITDYHKKNAKLISQTIIKLQGLFIKVGQLISILTNFLPQEFREGLESLQDKIPPQPYEDIVKRIHDELKKNTDELFITFDKIPIASASIAQVHFATLPNGDKVAVKIQHLGLEELVKTDLKIIKRVIQIIQFFLPVKNLMVYYQQVKEMIEQELDFVIEAKHIELISKNFVNHPKVSFPKVYPHYSSKHILTTSLIDGVKIADIQKLNELNIDKTQLAKLLIETYCQMIFSDGIYHADPHPGNIFIKNDGSVAFIDFGAVGTLSPSMKMGVSKFVEGVIKRDTGEIVESLRKMGFLVEKDPEVAVEPVIEYFYNKIQEEIRIDSLNLQDIKVDPEKTMEHFFDLRKFNVGLRELSKSFQIPKDWVLLERTLLIIMGICTDLDPQLNPTSVIFPYLQTFVLGKDKNWTNLVINAGRETLMSLISLPSDFKKYINQTLRGEIKTYPIGLNNTSKVIYALGQQFIYVLITISSSFMAYDMWIKNNHSGTKIFCSISILFFTIYLLSRVRNRKLFKKHY